MATNTVNGKRYVGATSQGLRRRRNHHIASAKAGRQGCTVFNAAICKYGADAFSWSIISEINSVDEMANEEIKLISELRPEYNVAAGGRGVTGAKHSPEWNAKIGKGNSRVVICTNTGTEYASSVVAAKAVGVSQSRISVACLTGGLVRGLKYNYSDSDVVIAPWQTMDGIEERKRRNSKNVKKAIDKTRVPIICVNNGKKFRSITDAEIFFGIRLGMLSLNLRRGHRSKGLTFAYSDKTRAA